jgi:hypothetical protein
MIIGLHYIVVWASLLIITIWIPAVSTRISFWFKLRRKEGTNIITTQKADLDSVEHNSNWLGLFAPYPSQHQTSKTLTLHINNTSVPQKKQDHGSPTFHHRIPLHPHPRQSLPSTRDKPTSNTRSPSRLLTTKYHIPPTPLPPFIRLVPRRPPPRQHRHMPPLRIHKLPIHLRTKLLLRPTHLLCIWRARKSHRLLRRQCRV